MKYLSKHSKTALAIASALVGAVMGAVVQDILNSDFRFLTAIAAVLSLGIVGLLVGQAAFADSHRAANEQVVAGTQAVLVEARKSRLEQQEELRRIAGDLAKNMTSLASQFGLRVERLLLADVNAMASLDEDQSAQLILSAQEELCILDILSDEGRWPDEAMDEQHAADYFGELMKHIRESSPPVSYKRIVQVVDPKSSLLGAKNARFIEHCYAMLELRRLRGRRVSLRVARRRFPFKFMLIDRSRLVLQLQEYDGGSAALKIWGEILISDPNRDLIAIFREIWEQVDDDAETRTVTEVDLPASPPSTVATHTSQP
jgi:hypothetical protein